MMQGTTTGGEAPEGFPVLDDDYFSEENLADSRTVFARIRDLGDAVWSPSPVCTS